MQERILEVLACRYVDDVVIGAPFIITLDLIKSLNISKVVHVQTHDDLPIKEYAETDQYGAARDLSIYYELPRNENELTVREIAKRIQAQKQGFMKKLEKKNSSE